MASSLHVTIKGLCQSESPERKPMSSEVKYLGLSLSIMIVDEIGEKQ